MRKQNPPGAAQVTIGIDLGGTGTRIVALASDGQVVAEDITPTAEQGPSRRAVRNLAEHIRVAAGDAEITAVGIGASGPVDLQGVIRNQATLPAYSDVPITAWITDELSVPCVIDNDAATAALGEHAYGAGRGSNALLVLTLGTGLGVALLSGGQPFRTARGLHPEGGHLSVPGPDAPCYCGLATCWEQLASRSALDRMTTLTIDAEAAAARAGQQQSRRVFERYGAYVASGLTTLLTLFEPDRVVLSGGSVPYLDLFGPSLLRAVERPDSFGSTAPVVAASLGAHSGAVGAAVKAWPSR